MRSRLLAGLLAHCLLINDLLDGKDIPQCPVMTDLKVEKLLHMWVQSEIKCTLNYYLKTSLMTEYLGHTSL